MEEFIFDFINSERSPYLQIKGLFLGRLIVSLDCGGLERVDGSHSVNKNHVVAFKPASYLIALLQKISVRKMQFIFPYTMKY